MRLTLTDEQALIESSVVNFLANEYDFNKREQSLKAGSAQSSMWQQFAHMGWLALPLPEYAGGIGAGALECGLLMRAFGRHLVIEPFASSALRAMPLFAAHGRAEQRDAWLPGLIDGSRRCILAHEESGRPLADTSRATLAVRNGSAWHLGGSKQLVQGAGEADLLLVSASTPEPDGGQRIFLLAPDTPGLRLSPARLMDGSAAADLFFDNIQLTDNDMLGHDVDAKQVLDVFCAQHLVFLAWEASGAMQALQEKTADYVRQRKQFGQPLAQFQVIAHRLAEMAVCCVEALAVCELAALRIDAGVDDPMSLASMARSKVGREARFVAQQAVQLHGAMGITEELPVASYFRKLSSFCQQAGSTTTHSRQFGDGMLQSKGWGTSRTLVASTLTGSRA